MPALGLSNKAIYLEQVAAQDKELYGAGDLRPQLNPQYSEAYFAPLQLSGECVCVFVCVWGRGGNTWRLVAVYMSD